MVRGVLSEILNIWRICWTSRFLDGATGMVNGAIAKILGAISPLSKATASCGDAGPITTKCDASSDHGQSRTVRRSQEIDSLATPGVCVRCSFGQRLAWWPALRMNDDQFKAWPSSIDMDIGMSAQPPFQEAGSLWRLWNAVLVMAGHIIQLVTVKYIPPRGNYHRPWIVILSLRYGR
jgi:hypothetical protein